jgi:hypothetical protein
MLGVARVAPLAEEWAYRRTRRAALARLVSLPARLAPARLRRTGSTSTAPGELTRLDSVEQVAALDLPPPGDALAVVRDLDHIRWRYFSGESDVDVLRFSTGAAPDRLVVVNRVTAGHRGQIRVLNVLDVWPPLDPGSAPALGSALADRYRGSFDTLWLRSQPPAAEEALAGAGFVRHLFPYTLGWCMDPGGLLPTRDWYLVPGDSE